MYKVTLGKVLNPEYLANFRAWCVVGFEGDASAVAESVLIEGEQKGAGTAARGAASPPGVITGAH